MCKKQKHTHRKTFKDFKPSVKTGLGHAIYFFFEKQGSWNITNPSQKYPNNKVLQQYEGTNRFPSCCRKQETISIHNNKEEVRANLKRTAALPLSEKRQLVIVCLWEKLPILFIYSVIYLFIFIQWMQCASVPYKSVQLSNAVHQSSPHGGDTHPMTSPAQKQWLKLSPAASRVDKRNWLAHTTHFKFCRLFLFWLALTCLLPKSLQSLFACHSLLLVKNRVVCSGITCQMNFAPRRQSTTCPRGAIASCASPILWPMLSATRMVSDFPGDAHFLMYRWKPLSLDSKVHVLHYILDANRLRMIARRALAGVLICL